MTKNKLPLAVALAAFAMACADPAGPTRALLPTASTLALNPVPGYPFPSSPIDGLVTLCKISNVAGTFDFDVSVNGGTATQVSITVDPGEENTRVCHTDPLFNSDLGSGQVDEVVIVEDDPGAGVTVTVDIDQYFVATLPYHASALLDEFDVSPRTATVFINDDLEKRVTFTNTAPDEQTGCTYTKGWYRNNGSSTVIAVDGRSVADAQAIFNATPGKPGTVTFGGNNTLLNLYQQLLAALNNLAGDPLGGPDDVDDAIADALAGTSGGPGVDITTTLTQTEMSDLIDVLSAFNEGEYAGWPHCDD
jgi:hypothetical protein